jgi:hypothetical protein
MMRFILRLKANKSSEPGIPPSPELMYGEGRQSIASSMDVIRTIAKRGSHDANAVGDSSSPEASAT